MSNFYVRPAGTVYGNADGSSFNDAWTAFAGVDWTGSGVQPGDTLFVSGEYEEEFVIGGSGNATDSITVEMEDAILNGALNQVGINLASFEYLVFKGGVMLGSQGVETFSGVNNTNIDIDGVKFNGYGFAILFDISTTGSLSDITIQNCEFYNHESPATIRFITETTSLGPITNIDIKNNKFIGSSGIEFLHDNYVNYILLNGHRPVAINIHDNEFMDIVGSTLTLPGVSGTGIDQSYVKNNKFLNCGGSLKANINVISLGNNLDLIIQDNMILDPTTDISIASGDGNGILLDAVGGLPCLRTIIRNNHFKGATASSESAGIYISSANLSQIYSNIFEENAFGVVIDVNASGNEFHNNLFKNNVNAGSRHNVTNTSIWNNNIFVGNGLGIDTNIGVTIPTESDNWYFDNTVNIFVGITDTAPTNARLVDPVLDADNFATALPEDGKYGKNWWGTNPRPITGDGSGIPDIRPGFGVTGLSNVPIETSTVELRIPTFIPRSKILNSAGSGGHLNLGIITDGSTIYASQGTRYLAAIDATDPSNPVLADTVRSSGIPVWHPIRNAAVIGNRVAMVCRNGGVGKIEVFDKSDITNLITLDRQEFASDFSDIATDGESWFIAGQEEGAIKYSNTVPMVQTGLKQGIDWETQGITVSKIFNDRQYYAFYSNYVYGLRILDCATMGNVLDVSIDRPNYKGNLLRPWKGRVKTIGTKSYFFACGNSSGDDLDTTCLMICDVTDLNNLEWVSVTPISGGGDYIWNPGAGDKPDQDIVLYKDYAFIAHASVGVSVFDIRNPLIPVYLGSYNNMDKDNGAGGTEQDAAGALAILTVKDKDYLVVGDGIHFPTTEGSDQVYIDEIIIPT